VKKIDEFITTRFTLEGSAWEKKRLKQMEVRVPQKKCWEKTIKPSWLKQNKLVHIMIHMKKKSFQEERWWDKSA